jgi:hypothetical protein
MKTKEIPNGPYCYGYNGMLCPHWSINKNHPHQLNGYCGLMKIGDWMEYAGELWDQVKMCGINEAYTDE